MVIPTPNKTTTRNKGSFKNFFTRALPARDALCYIITLLFVKQFDTP